MQPTSDKRRGAGRKEESIIRIQEVEVVLIPIPIEIEASVTQIRRPTVDANEGASVGSIVTKHPHALLLGQDALERLGLPKLLSPLCINLGEELVDIRSCSCLKLLRC